MTQPQYQSHQEIILDADTDYRQVLDKDIPAEIGDVVVVTRGQFVISQYRAEKGQVIMTCLAQPIKA